LTPHAAPAAGLAHPGKSRGEMLTAHHALRPPSGRNEILAHVIARALQCGALIVEFLLVALADYCEALCGGVALRCG
jgi:hypothetical protein